MPHEADVKRVAAELRTEVAAQLDRGDAPSAVARGLEARGMRRADARRFVTYVRRRGTARVRPSTLLEVVKQVATLLLGAGAGLAACVVGAVALKHVTESVGSMSGLTSLSPDETTTIARLGGLVLGIVVAAIARSMHSMSGTLGALAGSAAGIALLLTGRIL